METKVRKVDYHRNGCGGEGFFVALFDTRGEGIGTKHMLGVAFPEYDEDTGAITSMERTAVFDADLLAEGVIGMFEERGNAWRGADHYGATMRRAAALWSDKTDQPKCNHADTTVRDTWTE